MKFNDSTNDDSFIEKRDENYFDGIEHSTFAKRKSGFTVSRILEVPGLFYIIGGIAVAVFVGLIVMKTGTSFDSESLKAMDSRLKQMEDRFIDLGLVEKKLAGIEQQGEKIDSLLKRIETLESNLSARLDRIADKIETSGRSVVPKSQAATPVSHKKAVTQKSRAAEDGSTVYHQVRSGDTLYSIGRRYDLSLKALRELNPSLSSKQNIYPGQKLRIKKRR